MMIIRQWHQRHFWLLIGFLIIGGISAYFGWQWYLHHLAGKHLQFAYNAIEKQMFSNARENALVSLSHCESAEAHLLTARLTWQLSLLKNVQHHLNRARELSGITVEYQFEQMLFRAQRGENDPTLLASLRRYIDDTRTEAPLCREALCRGALINQKLEQALEILLQWRENQGEKYLQYHFCFGMLYQEVEQFEKATKSFARIVEHDPKRQLARLGLAESLKMQELYVSALPHYQYLYDHGFNHKLVLLGLATCLLYLEKELSLAESYAQQILKREPDTKIAIRLLGQIALKDNRLKEAESYLRESLRGNPGDSIAQYNLIKCLTRLGKNTARAQKRFDEVVKRNKRFNELNRERLQAKDIELPAIYSEMAILLLKNSADDEAIRFLNGALTYDPNHKPSHRLLYQYYAKHGDFEKAQEHLQYLPDTPSINDDD